MCTKAKFYFTFVLLVMCVACSIQTQRPMNIDFYVQDELSLEEATKVGKDWETFTAGRAHFTFRRGNGHPFIRLASRDTLAKLNPTAGCGLEIGDSQSIYIAEDCYRTDARWFALTLRHEIGHSLGLDHIREGVMSQRNQGDVFTKADGMECLRAGVCVTPE